ncbi:MAG TPA: galactokinase family protein [Vicinamibacterales bacterium]|nr:galactokinase family protein [Vicinamibacterales bacterium]
MRRRAWFVPGRIEVLGKHTDYAGGRSLLCAIDRGFRIEAAPRDDSIVTVTDRRGGASIALPIDPQLPPAPGDWPHYARTVVRRFARDFPSARRGADLIFESDLPAAAGLSSSSAFIVSVFLALAGLNDLSHDKAYTESIRTLEDLATYLSAVENGSAFGPLRADEGVGTAGGSEDHTAMLCCREGRVSQFRFYPTRFERSIELPERYTFAVAASGVAAEKAGAAREPYNRAAHLAKLVLEAWHAAAGSADASLGDAVRSTPDAPEQIRRVLTRPELIDRFEQFVEESESIVPAAGDALADGRLEEFGRIVDRSQHLAEQKLRNQVPETVALAIAARENGALAASSFGAGFGGAVWALVEAANAGPFLAGWLEAYRRQFGDAAARAEFFVSRPGHAAREI